MKVENNERAKMGGEIESLQTRISDLEEQNDNLIIEKDLAMTKMEQVSLGFTVIWLILTTSLRHINLSLLTFYSFSNCLQYKRSHKACRFDLYRKYFLLRLTIIYVLYLSFIT